MLSLAAVLGPQYVAHVDPGALKGLDPVPFLEVYLSCLDTRGVCGPAPVAVISIHHSPGPRAAFTPHTLGLSSPERAPAKSSEGSPPPGSPAAVSREHPHEPVTTFRAPSGRLGTAGHQVL